MKYGTKICHSPGQRGGTARATSSTARAKLQGALLLLLLRKQATYFDLKVCGFLLNILVNSSLGFKST
ncbi:hypothetical protein MTR_2g070320 [Medicago truncatula]|uniref:Uncharacterized protein n=1 Tax=Medicago truncatula TaxID=3880 RepID=A0A072VAJ7_MEDTR|nr:hypothetical protein MTR_2g070320 [Medicago truncatula]